MSRRDRTSAVRGWFAELAGVGLGALAVPADLVAAARPDFRERRVRTELRRIVRWHGAVDVPAVDSARCGPYLLARSALGLLGAGVVVLLLLTLVVALSMVTAWLFDGDWALLSDGGRVGTGLVALVALPGLVLLFLLVVGVLGVGALDRWLAESMLDSARDLRRRVAHLTTTRDQVVDAVDEERRRIERDLHDGLQQRLVAIGVTLGRARRAGDAARAQALVDDAAAVSRDALHELREVTERIYPAALADGLIPALDRLRERGGIAVELDGHPAPCLRPATATATYFAVAESVTNAAKHAGTDRVRIEVAEQEGLLSVTVTDHGRGGADPGGRGLSGVARRVAAVDGTLRVDSPAGGPTTIRVTVPCG